MFLENVATGKHDMSEILINMMTGHDLEVFFYVCVANILFVPLRMSVHGPEKTQPTD